MSDPGSIVAARLADLWRTSRPTVLERVAILRDAHQSLAADPADSEARTRGREAAHKLSGVLGVFGLPRGSELAAEIEALLKTEGALSPDQLSSLSLLAAELDAVIASKPAG
ncbi:MAG TPA: Hpt domain-containing protein [Acidobacteriaceae bacterium]|nr:Hpt domain-containing protein [Acidobacteriaceae bacterium]